MSDPDAPLNSDQTSQIDNACDALESAWQSGKEPHLSEFVAGQTAEQRQACFVELAKVDYTTESIDEVIIMGDGD